ncbi:MAG: hypothetical protein WBX25_09895 [Rhodomicrobium sp.]
MTEAIEKLKSYLTDLRAGSLIDASYVGGLLPNCWGDLDGSDATNMRADKLWRIEELEWKPPCLEFVIERHGQTVNGSTRATAYRWSYDLEKGTARIIGEKRRQLYAMDRRLDVKPIAEGLADAIIRGKPDARIVREKGGAVRLKMGAIIPATNKETTASRRSRLRNHLLRILVHHGWKKLRTNVYHAPN